MEGSCLCHALGLGLYRPLTGGSGSFRSPSLSIRRSLSLCFLRLTCLTPSPVATHFEMSISRAPALCEIRPGTGCLNQVFWKNS